MKKPRGADATTCPPADALAFTSVDLLLKYQVGLRIDR